MEKLLLAPLLFFYVCTFGQTFSVLGIVRDKATGKPIRGAIVTKIGSDGSVEALKTDTGGHYLFAAKTSNERYVKPNTSYILSADANDQGYLASQVKATISTVGLSDSKTWTDDFELQKGGVIIDKFFPDVVFGEGKFELTMANKDSLHYIYLLLINNPSIVLEADGCADDNEGGLEKCVQLSEARSGACWAYFISQGIDSARVKTKGWGYSVPLYSAKRIESMKTKKEKEDAHAANRRVDFRVLRFDYVPKK
jgi:outer membrane protein OmpA-like peptidoglycan-associated protein